MKRKLVLILCLTFFLSLSLTLSAQDYYKKQKPAPVQESREETVPQEKYQDPEKGQQAILKKLDQLLAGQAKIMQELEIVKVRASRR